MKVREGGYLRIFLGSEVLLLLRLAQSIVTSTRYQA